MVASDDSALIDHCRYLATQARQPVLHYEHHDIGFNYRMSNIIAAIGIGQLEVLTDRVNKKRLINEQYQNFLGDTPGLSFMPEASYGRANRWLTTVLVDRKTFGAEPLDIIAALDAENIESRPVWNPLHLNKAFADCRTVGGAVSESLYKNGVCLPSGSIMTEWDVNRVSDIIRRVAK